MLIYTGENRGQNVSHEGDGPAGETREASSSESRGRVQRNSPPWNSSCSSGSRRGALSMTGFGTGGDGGASLRIDERDLAGDDERRQQQYEC